MLIPLIYVLGYVCKSFCEFWVYLGIIVFVKGLSKIYGKRKF